MDLLIAHFTHVFGEYLPYKKFLLPYNQWTRLQRWAHNRTLSFIPPDGKFVLVEYRYSPTSSSSTTSPQSLTNVAQENVPIPFAVKSEYDIEDNSGMVNISRILAYLFAFNEVASFNLTLTSRLSTKPLQNVVVELNLGEGASGIKCVASRGTGGLGRGGVSMNKGVVGNSGASWAFDARQKVYFILCS